MVGASTKIGKMVLRVWEYPKEYPIASPMGNERILSVQLKYN